MISILAHTKPLPDLWLKAGGYCSVDNVNILCFCPQAGTINTKSKFLIETLSLKSCYPNLTEGLSQLSHPVSKAVLYFTLLLLSPMVGKVTLEM